ncbi:hypothetical protein PEBR_40110 [Penicillium brasilianum]|uniref:Uncharacterized protein n=1 Tax=Penicillium brasilianum TaxID=104259 RepID=A0A1S9RAM6_PENBI|nr:hypothetical protein PEBR_40110 [Penicillium brasilianum]
MQTLAATEGSFSSLTEIRQMREQLAEINTKTEEMKAKMEEMNAQTEELSQSFLNNRQRAFTTWVRDALDKGTTRRLEDIQRPTEDFIYNGDIRCDARLVTQRYEKNGTAWRRFSTLYGLTPNDFKNLDRNKCCGSLQALDRAADILFKHAWTRLPTKAMEKQREDLVAMLLEEEYEEAENMSSGLFCEEYLSEAEVSFDTAEMLDIDDGSGKKDT